MYFHRQVELWGEKTQKSLKNKKIAIIGCGGLGCNLGIILGSSGIGEIDLVDYDKVSIHNIHRQIAFRLKDENKSKAKCLAKLIKKRYDKIKVNVFDMNFDEYTKHSSNVNLVIDASDNLPTRAKIDEFCIKNTIPWVYGSVEAFHGQVCFFENSSFKSFNITNRKPSGIAGAIVMQVASFQANLALRYLANLSVKKDLLYYISYDKNGVFNMQKFNMPQENLVKNILIKSKNLAIAGLSPNEEKASFKVAKYMQEQGFNIFPIYPKEDEILGQKVYRSLSDIKDKIDVVVMFRKAEFAKELFEEIKKREDVSTLWLQLGIVNEDVKKEAIDFGINFIHDKCIKIEHQNIYN